MNSEHEFLRQRLELVKEYLANPDGDYIYAGDGRVSRRTRPEHRRDTRSHREARLLQKLLAQTREGQVLVALISWRGQFGQFLREHRQSYRDMQQIYDEWWKLPPYRRETIPQPPQPPPARFIDKNGAPWIIDDRFLALLDDLIERLQRWLKV